MKLTGATVHYVLSREFDDVTCDRAARRIKVDYPLLFDPSSDMNGHAVLVPEHETPDESLHLKGSLCVCMGGRSADAARDAGFAVIEVRGEATFARVYNHLQLMFAKGEALDARIHAYVDSYAGFQRILDACAQTIGLPCAIVDAQYRGVCRSAPAVNEDAGADADMLEADVVDLFMASRGYRHQRLDRGVFTMPGAGDALMKNIFSGERLVGTLVMHHSKDTLSARYAWCALNYMAPLVEEMYARIGSFDISPTESERVRKALQDALTGRASAIVRLQAALAEGGHDSNTRYVVLRIERSFTNEGPEEHGFLARRFELAWPEAYCFVEAENLYMLVDVGGCDSDREHAFSREMPLVARENLSKTGISRAFASMSQLHDALLQADGALACGNALDPTRWCYWFRDYALSWLVLQAKQGGSNMFAVHPALDVLKRYDVQHDACLMETLLVFMRSRYNATAAANELYVARSTLLNRLERICELTGIDLDDSSERLYLALSFAMLRAG